MELLNKQKDLFDQETQKLSYEMFIERGNDL